MIILLDLNYTLVANSEVKLRPFVKQIEQETYRQWLVDFCKDHHVVLITARPEKYRVMTLERIERLTGWRPCLAFFNTHNLFPPEHKRRVLTGEIFPRFGDAAYVAIESNPATRAMYARHKIPSLYVPGKGKDARKKNESRSQPGR